MRTTTCPSPSGRENSSTTVHATRLLIVGVLLACSAAALAQDKVQPPPVSLSAATGKTSAVISWSALGDACGGASLSENDVRYSTSSINECNFTSASQANVLDDGCAEAFGLSCNTTYYFAWKGKDSAGNWSDIATTSKATKSCTSSQEVACP